MIAALLAALSVGQAAETAPMTERTDRLDLSLSREDGQNIWRAGPYSGAWSGRGTAMNVMNIRRRNTARVELSFAGPGFEAGPVQLSCAGGDSEFELFWITWERSDLAYACTATRDGAALDTRFELALQRGRGFMGRARNERAGELRHDGQVVQFETQRLSGVSFPSGRVPGYVIRSDGREIAGMDYGVMRPTVYLPPEGDPEREIALIAAIVLATFFDPANMNN